ncbi:hypothetical protein E2C01_024176 [Portunus trituberculatus]|uniref:Uncharacterized protein n=1 Tax=Portunus trituberculatus TaxID=210409 RepID=A0A5B7EC12_PORTR|nr:hypothetical protein [Portunus trituberculatus]
MLIKERLLCLGFAWLRRQGQRCISTREGVTEPRQACSTAGGEHNGEKGNKTGDLVFVLSPWIFQSRTQFRQRSVNECATAGGGLGAAGAGGAGSGRVVARLRLTTHLTLHDGLFNFPGRVLGEAEVQPCTAALAAASPSHAAGHCQNHVVCLIMRTDHRVRGRRAHESRAGSKGTPVLPSPQSPEQRCGAGGAGSRRRAGRAGVGTRDRWGGGSGQAVMAGRPGPGEQI